MVNTVKGKRKAASKSSKTAKTKTKRQPSIKRIGEHKGVCEYRLANGLKILLLPNHTAPVATLLVLFKVGSRNEGVGYTGSTHFLEHMLFKGTKKHNPEKGNGIDDILTQIGAYWNATTWFDRTSYFEVVPAEYLPICIELEADRMRNLLLRQEDHDSEMSVVRNELERGENYPEEALEKELYAVAFREHPYHHPTIGWRTDVEGVSMERLRAFYDTYYWPSNATVIVVGDFSVKETLEHLNKHYGKISAAPKPIPTVYTVEPPQEGERRLVINRFGDLPRVWIGFHVPEASHNDTYALAAIRHILGGTNERSSRLYKKLIDTNLACEVFARHDDLRDPALFIVGATINPGVELETVEKALLAELANLAKNPVEADELTRAKSANIKGTILAKADPSTLAFMLGESESRSDWHWLMDYDDKFEAVTPAEIVKAAARYFQINNRTVAHFQPRVVREIPEESHTAPPGKAAERNGDGKGHKAAAENKKINPTALLRTRPKSQLIKPVKSSSVRKSFKSRVQKEVLPNGLTVLLMENPGTESLGLSVYSTAGRYFAHSLPGSQAELLGELMPKGTHSFSKTAIAEALEGMGISSGLDLAVDNFRSTFGTNLITADLPDYLNLLAEVMRMPIIPEDELEKTKVEWRSRFAEAMNNTRSIAWNGLKRAIYPANHPFGERSFEAQIEEISKVTADDLRQLHKRLYNPKGTIITVVGDQKLDHTLDLIKRRFGDWHGGDIASIAVEGVDLPAKPELIKIHMPDKASADVVLAHPSTLKRTNPDYYAARLANAALGQDTITSRLGYVVRDKAGLTYGVYSGFGDTAFGVAPWSVTLSVNPRNVTKALGLVNEVLQDYAKRGISPDELSKECGRAVGAFKVGLASSIGMSRAITEFEFLGLGIEGLDQVPENYLSVTKKQVDQATRNYFHPEKAITVAAGTFE